MIVRTDQVLFSHHVSNIPTDTHALHCHTVHECYYIVRGDVQYLVEGVAYTPAPHSMLLMASGVFHGMRIISDAPYERYALHFDPACLPAEGRGLLLAPFYDGGIYYTGADQFRMAAFFQAIADCKGMSPSLRDTALPVRIAALLTQVCALHDAQNAAPPAGGLALDRQIVSYINQNITSPLPLEDIARHFFISRSQLCRNFKRATGTTVAAYVRQKRLLLAQRLQANGQSASQAAVNAGFGDYTTYFRARNKQLSDT